MRRAVALPSVEQEGVGAVLVQEEIAAPAALDCFMNLHSEQKDTKIKGCVQATSPFIFRFYQANCVIPNINEKTRLIEL